MANVFDRIDDKLARWLSAQPVFFVGTAPLSGDGHVNVSPKGMDGTFAILLFEEPTGQAIVFASNAAGGLFLEKEEELRRYRSSSTICGRVPWPRTTRSP